MIDELRTRLFIQLVRHEGKRNRMYTDSRGIATIGIGHNLRDVPISDRAVTVMFEDDLATVERDLERELPWVAALVLPRQAALYDMAFNLGIGSAAQGTGLLGFVRMLVAAETGDFEGAARQILTSRYRTQVGDRAVTVAAMMRTGQWPSWLESVLG